MASFAFEVYMLSEHQYLICPEKGFGFGHIPLKIKVANLRYACMKPIPSFVLSFKKLKKKKITVNGALSFEA